MRPGRWRGKSTWPGKCKLCGKAFAAGAKISWSKATGAWCKSCTRVSQAPSPGDDRIRDALRVAEQQERLEAEADRDFAAYIERLGRE